MMKTLYESILSSTNSGKAHFDEITKKKIDEWMNKYNGACKYVINDDLTITLIKTISTETIYLYAEYNELPEYIKFKNCENYNIAIYNAKNIKSFKGLPAQCNEFYIISPALKELPPLKISCNNCYINSQSLQKIKDLEINFVKTSQDETVLKIERIGTDNLESIHAKNVEVICIGEFSRKLSGEFSLSNKFCKLFERKAKLNTPRTNYEYPISDEGLKIMNDFLGENINQSSFRYFNYSAKYALTKHNGKWYRIKK